MAHYASGRKLSVRRIAYGRRGDPSLVLSLKRRRREINSKSGSSSSAVYPRQMGGDAISLAVYVCNKNSI